MPSPEPAVSSADRAYTQPAPRVLYVHEDLTAEVRRRLGPGSPALDLAGALLDHLRAEGERVRVITLDEQIERVIAQGPHEPFDLAIGVGRAGERVACQLHARTGWFPRVRRVGLTREEDGRGGYAVVSTEPASLAAQLDGVGDARSLALVDDTIFSGLTIHTLLDALPDAARDRARVFCLRSAAESLAAVAARCPATAGIAAPGRLLDDVSFINATGLVLRISIRRRGQPPLAFFDRPEWLRAWFPRGHASVLALCRELNTALEPAGRALSVAPGHAGGALGARSPRGTTTRSTASKSTCTAAAMSAAPAAPARMVLTSFSARPRTISVPYPPPADEGGQRGRAHRRHGRRLDPRHDADRGQRQLDAESGGSDDASPSPTATSSCCRSIVTRPA